MKLESIFRCKAVMPKSNLIDFCVVIGSNKDTNLEKLSCEGSQGYGPYKQNVLAVLSENIAYFPESYHVIDGWFFFFF